MLVFIKSLHTLVWALFVFCILGIFAAAAAGKLRVALLLILIVMVEVVILLANRLQCPLTAVAARYTPNRAANFDIYLPLWLARYNKEIFGPLYVAGLLYTLVQWLE